MDISKYSSILCGNPHGTCIVVVSWDTTHVPHTYDTLYHMCTYNLCGTVNVLCTVATEGGENYMVGQSNACDLELCCTMLKSGLRNVYDRILCAIWLSKINEK
jgi:hypothetical protein